ncbi:DUF87 domain-containing protein, partial [Frankia sp. AvcI1]
MLDGFQFHRILATPRRPEGTDRPDPVPPALFAALVGAHAELTSLGPGPAAPGVAVAWLRGPGEAHIRFLAGGRPYFPPGTIPAAPPSPIGPSSPIGPPPLDGPDGWPEGGGLPPGDAWPGSQDGGLPPLPPLPRPPRSARPRPASAPRAAGPAPLLYPPGSTAVALAPGAVLDDLARFPYWLRCGGSPDALWAPGPGGEGGSQPPPGARRGSFDDYAAHLVGPFAWLVLAWPVTPHRLAEERDALARSIPALRLREHDQDARLDLERAERRHRELGRAAASGMWDVEILVGGASRAGAFSLAALLCSSSDLDELPYTLRPLGPATSFAGARAPRPADPADGAERSPFRAGAELLAALARPPGRELPGITLITPHTFDVTPEGPDGSGPADPRGAPGAVRLGDVLDAGWSPAGTLAVPRSTLNRHAFVCGATGSGKSQTVRSLLESLARAPAPVPWLVLEPAKAEYARMAGRLADLAGPPDVGDAARPGEVLVIRPGRLDAAPASLNPLEPEAGFPLQSHLDLVRALFLAAFEAHEPFPQVLARALTVCYRDLGWNLVLDRPEPPYRPRFRVYGPDADDPVEV